MDCPVPWMTRETSNSIVSRKMMSWKRRLLLVPRYVWTCPWTCCGALIGLVGLATGGACRCQGGVIQFWGGGVARFLERFPAQPFAMTLGHAILGRSEAAVDLSWEHELVHVRQYESWGPLFVPAYLGCSLVLWLQRRDPYRENPFECEAYGDGA